MTVKKSKVWGRQMEDVKCYVVYIKVSTLHTKWPYYWYCGLGDADAGTLIMLEGNVHMFWMSHLPIFKNVCVKDL
jgi:hypothetical protein